MLIKVKMNGLRLIQGASIEEVRSQTPLYVLERLERMLDTVFVHEKTYHALNQITPQDWVEVQSDRYIEDQQYSQQMLAELNRTQANSVLEGLADLADAVDEMLSLDGGEWVAKVTDGGTDIESKQTDELICFVEHDDTGADHEDEARGGIIFNYLRAAQPRMIRAVLDGWALDRVRLMGIDPNAKFDVEAVGDLALTATFEQANAPRPLAVPDWPAESPADLAVFRASRSASPAGDAMRDHLGLPRPVTKPVATGRYYGIVQTGRENEAHLKSLGVEVADYDDDTRGGFVVSMTEAAKTEMEKYPADYKARLVFRADDAGQTPINEMTAEQLQGEIAYCDYMVAASIPYSPNTATREDWYSKNGGFRSAPAAPSAVTFIELRDEARRCLESRTRTQQQGGTGPILGEPTP